MVIGAVVKYQKLDIVNPYIFLTSWFHFFFYCANITTVVLNKNHIEAVSFLKGSNPMEGKVLQIENKPGKIFKFQKAEVCFTQHDITFFLP